MIEASSRYVPHVAILLTFAIALVLAQGRTALDVEDCENPPALFPKGDPVAKPELSAERTHVSRDRAVGESGRWIEGSVKSPGGLQLRYTILRSFHPRRIYHRPGRNLVTNARSRTDVVEEVPDGDRIVPIHRLRFESSRRGGQEHDLVAAYLMVYRGEPIAHPVRAQFRAVPMELVSGRRPMTLYLVHTFASGGRRAEAEEATRRWLLERWHTHASACRQG